MEEESGERWREGLCGFVLESCGLNEWRRMNVCVTRDGASVGVARSSGIERLQQCVCGCFLR